MTTHYDNSGWRVFVCFWKKLKAPKNILKYVFSLSKQRALENLHQTYRTICIFEQFFGIYETRFFFMKPWRFDIRYRSSMEKCQLAWSRSRIKYFLNVQISFILQHGNEIMNPNLQCFIHSSVYLTIAYKPFLLDTI